MFTMFCANSACCAYILRSNVQHRPVSTLKVRKSINALVLTTECVLFSVALAAICMVYVYVVGVRIAQVRVFVCPHRRKNDSSYRLFTCRFVYLYYILRWVFRHTHTHTRSLNVWLHTVQLNKQLFAEWKTHKDEIKNAIRPKLIHKCYTYMLYIK